VSSDNDKVPPRDNVSLNEVALARENEYRRCDVIRIEFGREPDFVLTAICAGWSVERARQEFFTRNCRYNNDTTSRFAS
jgi:hypothetical protein